MTNLLHSEIDVLLSETAVIHFDDDTEELQRWDQQTENSFEDISNKVVANFGCSCCTLGVAAALLGADLHVTSVKKPHRYCPGTVALRRKVNQKSFLPRRKGEKQHVVLRESQRVSWMRNTTLVQFLKIKDADCYISSIPTLVSAARGTKRKPESFKDEDYYISSIPKNQHTEAGLSVKASEKFGSDRF